MKVSNIKDIQKFFDVVDSCAGKVELVTGEGDRLNLKSKLSQYVSLANIFSNGENCSLRNLAASNTGTQQPRKLAADKQRRTDDCHNPAFLP